MSKKVGGVERREADTELKDQLWGTVAFAEGCVSRVPASLAQTFCLLKQKPEG